MLRRRAEPQALPHPVANGASLSPNPTDSLICGSNTTYKLLNRYQSWPPPGTGPPPDSPAPREFALALRARTPPTQSASLCRSQTSTGSTSFTEAHSQCQPWGKKLDQSTLLEYHNRSHLNPPLHLHRHPPDSNSVKVRRQTHGNV